ncbi:hypothetical protein EJF36_16540 [Bacillus sp. HMF5848]|uniref:hypothetical protein n=1 Tax=Bacillus sp. HMF5848 TaxID=2495421 RepID=UPI000F783F8C|nr:hypothetical protein [Bacillus sp. HMF5848]RSK28342.1 hypothetical protein EJF36_16540 [Bacillus sp. HMF5848]
MNSKLNIFFQYLYKFFKVSFFFWLYLLKGLVIYAVIPSANALLVTLKNILEGVDEEDDIKALYKKNYEALASERMSSFLFSISFILIYTALFFVNKWSSSYSLAITLVLLYILALTVLLLLYSVYFLQFKNKNWKGIILLSFFSSIKYIHLSLAVLTLIIIMYFTATYNFAFFVIFGPFLFGLGTNLIFTRVKSV